MFKQTPVLLHTQQDFELRSMHNDTALCLKNPKTTFSLVFFYGPDCAYCDIFRPIFSKNSGFIQDCSFIMVNLNNNKNLIHISKETKTPITYVPFILLFHKNMPLVEYNGKDYTDDALKMFLLEAVRVFGPASQSQITAKPVTNSSHEMPHYEILNEGYASFEGYSDNTLANRADVCHLSFENAYV